MASEQAIKELACTCSVLKTDVEKRCGLLFRNRTAVAVGHPSCS